jgi:uncharacterized protein YigA (DUF484 family)
VTPDARTLVGSLVAVFLALATGIAVGTLVPGQDAVLRQQQAMIRRLEGEFDRLRDENRSFQAEIDALRGDAAIASRFAEKVLPAFAAGRLAGARVALVWVAGVGRDQRLRADLEAAGAVVVAEVEVGGHPADWPRAAQGLAGWLLGGGEGEGGEGGGPGPLGPPPAAAVDAVTVLAMPEEAATAVVLVGGRGDRASAAIPDVERFDRPFLRAARGRGAVVVACERRDAARSLVGLYARDGVPTVDDIDLPAGRLALLWILAGGEGDFGCRGAKTDLLPDLALPWGTGVGGGE